MPPIVRCLLHLPLRSISLPPRTVLHVKYLSTTCTPCYPRALKAIQPQRNHQRDVKDIEQTDSDTDNERSDFEKYADEGTSGSTIGMIPPDYLNSKRQKPNRGEEKRQQYSALAASLEANEASHLTFTDLLFLFDNHFLGTLSPGALKTLYQNLLLHPRLTLELEHYNQLFRHLLGPSLNGSIDDGPPPLTPEAIDLASSWIEDMQTLELEIDATALTYFLLTAESKSPEEVLKLWKKARKADITPTVEGWNVLIRTHLSESSSDFYKTPQKIWKKMQEAGVRPNLRTCEAMLHVAVKQKDVKAFEEILHTIRRSPLPWRQQEWAVHVGLLDTPSPQSSQRTARKVKSHPFYSSLLNFNSHRSKALQILRLLPIFKSFTPSRADLRVFLKACTFKFPPVSIPGLDELDTAHEKFVGKAILVEVVAPWIASLVKEEKVGKEMWDEVLGTLVGGQVDGVNVDDVEVVWKGVEGFVPRFDTLVGGTKFVAGERDLERAEKFFRDVVIVPGVLRDFEGEEALDAVYEGFVEAWVENGEDRLEELAGMVADIREEEARRRENLK
ncbi:hypothetical protein HK097_006590 [Rhizophlyctis rosea]|uniref:Uncharacterized protein n=1 Tax=Rhizophlyctis rosea TaxID=64517 RepID=A0AAD5X5P6_9FUNG|nr:hypothetical protein HK097_006590 [Rhizophlyctis rosea]